jgi:autotransporter-associated beta strand protein
LSSTQLTLTVGGAPANLIWNNAAATGNWSQDVSNENWDNTSAPDAQDRFFASDIVTFQDISGQPTQSVAIATAVEPGSIFVSNSVAGTAYTLTGEGIAGTTGITKTGTGTLNIAGTLHTFTGNVNLNGGTVKVALIDDATYPSSLGQGTSLSFDGGTLAYDEAFDAFTNRSITLQAGGGAIRVGDAATKLDLKAAIDGPGGFTKTGDGSVVLLANNSYVGTTTISAGTLQVGNGSTTGTLSTADVSIGGSLVINRSDAITLANNLSGAGSLVKAAANILTLTGTNTHGSTTINAGTISIGAATNLGSGALTFANLGTGLTITGAAVTLANNIALPASGTGNITLTTPDTSSTVFDGTLSGGAVGTVLFFQGGATGQNTGSLTLNGNNTGLLGSIQIQRGPLILGNANAAGSAAIVLNSNNPITGALQLAGSFTIANNIQIIDAGENIGVGTGLSAGISGVISGGNPITKVGAGTLTLSNTNTYTGTTAVSAGELRITGILETGGGTVTVATAGTLSGDGVINRAVTVNGSIAPGSGAVETLEITGTTTINGTYACQLDAATTDSLAITGNLTLGAASVLNVAEITAATTFPYVIATYTGTRTGTFVTVTPGYTVDYGTAGTILLKQGTAFDSWAALKGLDGTPGKEKGLNDDPDGDGLDNVIEFVLDNDPLSGTNANPPTINASGSDLVFTYTRRDDSEYLNPFVEFDTDLVAPWTVAVDPGNATIAVAENGSNPDVVTVTIPKGANTKLFARVNVTVP